MDDDEQARKMGTKIQARCPRTREGKDQGNLAWEYWEFNLSPIEGDRNLQGLLLTVVSRM